MAWNAVAGRDVQIDKRRGHRQLADELERTKELKLDIFNVGCRKKR